MTVRARGPIATVVLLAAIIVGALASADSSAGRWRAGAADLPSQAPVGIVSDTLARLDPFTLKPGDPRLELGEFHEAWSYSPDRSRIALGMGSPAAPVCGAGICIVDLESMSVVEDIDGPIAAEAVGWVSPRRIVAVLQSGQVIVADPETGETLPGHDLSADVYGPPSASIPGGFAVLIGGDPSRLATFDSGGNMRVASLKRIQLGVTPEAGLAVNPARRRAFVFAGDGPVAEVNLKSMRVRYHAIGRGAGRSATGRARLIGRCAVWLGRGRAAVASEDVQVGVEVIDTVDWSVRTVNRRANKAVRVGDRLVVYRSFARRGVGLRIYSRDGRRLLAHRFGDEALNVQIAGRYAYAIGSRELHLVDVRSGEVVHKSQQRDAGDALLLSSRFGSGYQCGH